MVEAAQADRPLGKLEQRRKLTAKSLSLAPTRGGLFNSEVTAHHPPELSPRALFLSSGGLTRAYSKAMAVEALAGMLLAARANSATAARDGCATVCVPRTLGKERRHIN